MSYSDVPPGQWSAEEIRLTRRSMRAITVVWRENTEADALSMLNLAGFDPLDPVDLALVTTAQLSRSIVEQILTRPGTNVAECLELVARLVDSTLPDEEL